jgi:hypothetical protein
MRMTAWPAIAVAAARRLSAATAAMPSRDQSLKTDLKLRQSTTKSQR